MTARNEDLKPGDEVWVKARVCQRTDVDGDVLIDMADSGSEHWIPVEFIRKDGFYYGLLVGLPIGFLCAAVPYLFQQVLS